ncbi:hypothetical protein HC931_13340 [Candidatus Gracilibacteria bacterium]|nr:hypothetical protein [Candidatus Gracilibacteria bacterium]
MRYTHTASNNPNAPDRGEVVYGRSRLSAAGDWERYAASVLGWGNTWESLMSQHQNPSKMYRL